MLTAHCSTAQLLNCSEPLPLKSGAGDDTEMTNIPSTHISDEYLRQHEYAYRNTFETHHINFPKNFTTGLSEGTR